MSSEFDCYVLDLDSIKDDMITMEKLLKRLQDGSEQIKTVHSPTNVKELQDMMDSDIDDVFIVAKSITQCLEGLERTNPASATDVKVSGPGSSVDRNRMNVVIEIGKKLKEMMDGFQWLGLKIFAAHKECVESIYYSVTKEKQSMESIEKFVGSGEIETFLRVAAGDEEGNIGIPDIVQEIQERINGAKYMQKCLVELQNMFLGMVALVEAQRKKLGAGGKEKTGGAVGGGGGVGGGGRGVEDFARKGGVSTQLLHSPAYDHEKEAKNRAIIAIVLTAISIVILILILAKLESDNIDKE